MFEIEDSVLLRLSLFLVLNRLPLILGGSYWAPEYQVPWENEARVLVKMPSFLNIFFC
jgi:hypothetical protein